MHCILKYCHSLVDVTGVSEVQLELSRVHVPQLTRSWLLPDAKADGIDEDNESSGEENESSGEEIEIANNYDTDTCHPGLEQT